MPKGIIGAIFVLIGLGLILRFGKDSNTLAGTMWGGFNNTLGILSLSGFNGNSN